ncbi:hypothetical protein [Gemmatimonas sp.]|uniref:hypothetical protein n=1 Tax=Gemmatimonas sp. TaxID=1962908 RepID=UPI0035618368
MHLFNARGESVGTLRNVQLGEPRTLGRFTYFASAGQASAVATDDSAFVELWNGAGSGTGGFRAGMSNRRPTAEQYRAAAELQSSQLAVEAQRRASVKFMLKQPMIEQLPSYSGIFPAGGRGYRVVDGFSGDTSLQLTRYSATGRLEARTALPDNARVVSAGRDGVLAILENVHGEQTVTWFHVGVR